MNINVSEIIVAISGIIITAGTIFFTISKITDSIITVRVNKKDLEKIKLDIETLKNDTGGHRIMIENMSKEISNIECNFEKISEDLQCIRKNISDGNKEIMEKIIELIK
jgi:hypothetical protein